METAKAPVICANPDIVIAIAIEGPDVVISQAVFGRIVGDSSILEAAQSVVRSDPDGSRVVLRQRRYKVIYQTILRGIGCKLSVLQPGEPASVGSDPEAGIVTLDQRPNFILFKLALLAGVECCDVHAVKSC